VTILIDKAAKLKNTRHVLHGIMQFMKAVVVIEQRVFPYVDQ